MDQTFCRQPSDTMNMTVCVDQSHGDWKPDKIYVRYVCEELRVIKSKLREAEPGVHIRIALIENRRLDKSWARIECED